MRQTLRLQLNAEKMYFVARSVSISASLVLSIAYSRLLGPENRGILSTVFICGLLTSQILCGGINLTFRSRLNGLVPEENIKRFLRISIGLTLLACTISSLILIAYTKFKTPIDLHYLVISLVYIFISVFFEQLMQLLLAFRNFKLASKLEVLVVGLQLSSFFFLNFINTFSIGVRVLIVLSLSYFIAGAISFKSIIKHRTSLASLKQMQITTWNLFSLSFHNSFYNSILSLADRADRILVLLIFSSEAFGKYSLFTGLIMIFRFIPETLGTLIVGGRAKRFVNKLHQIRVLEIMILLFLPVITSALTQTIIKGVFGQLWVLNYSVVLAFSCAELFRAIYLFGINSRISKGQKDLLHSKSISLVIFIDFLFAWLSWIQDNLLFIPAGICIAYVSAIWLIRPKNTAKKQNPAD